MKVISKQRNSKMCFICGMNNPIGLKAHFYNMEDGSVMTPFRFKEEHQSFPQRVHGGLISTMLDELGLRAIWAKQSDTILGVTINITVKFRKPVPYNEDLIGRGIVQKETPRFTVITAEIYNKSGVLLASAEETYMKLSAEAIAKNVDSHEEMCFVADDVAEINFSK